MRCMAVRLSSVLARRGLKEQWVPKTERAEALLHFHYTPVWMVLVQVENAVAGSADRQVIRPAACAAPFAIAEAKQDIRC